MYIIKLIILIPSVVILQMAMLSETSRFKADKGFKGAEGGERAAGRDAPVQFEKGRDSDRDRDDDNDNGGRGHDDRDPFGINDVVGNGSRSKRSRYE